MISEKIFDRQLLLKRKSNKAGIIQKADFLIKRSLTNIEEKLSDLSRDFPRVLNLGCRTGYGSDFLQKRSGTIQVTETDFCYEMLCKSNNPTIKVVCDEEFIPFADNSFDLIISVLNLHNINDLPGSLVQLRRILRPKGIIIASLFGENNLLKCKQRLVEIEVEASKQVSPRFAPNIDIKQMGMLLLRAGFMSSVVDKDTVTVEYKRPIDFLKDLQSMAETNILVEQSYRCPPKSIWNKFCLEDNFTAEFDILTITGSKD